MRKLNVKPAKAGNAKKTKASIGRISKEKPPTDAEIAKMQSLKLDDLPDKNEPIVLSETWYEYSVFRNKFNICPGTANNWLRKGWLAYSGVGKMRFINKTDIEDMMRHFRRPSIWTSFLTLLLNDSVSAIIF
jgi:hypothetical protein